MAPIGADGKVTNGWTPADPFVVHALREATIGELELLYDSSNYVFLATLSHDKHGEGLGVYKPANGERPLYDFPSHTLYRREVAAYELSTLLGWELVPPTVAVDGPHGPGSLQLYIEHDPAEHYFHVRDTGSYDEQLVRFAAFDLIANNADRKGGHLLLASDGHIWGIDNGLCFHEQQKLRTVIWDYAGTRLPRPWLQDLRRTLKSLPDDPAAAPLRDCLSRRELSALLERGRELLEQPRLPEMFPYRCVPWPLI